MSIKITTLDNGLRVVSDAMPRLKSASVGVWVDVGARHETASAHGISHMLEHMAFKGTARRSARHIAEEIEAVGGYLNAYTSREQTVFYARVLKGDIPLAVDILADILQNSVFDAEELAREQHVVIQEIGQAEDTPDDIIFDHLQEVAFPDQPLGRAILGTPQTVRGFTPARLKTYMRGNYQAPAMLLVGAGAVDHARLVDLAHRHFAGLPAAPAKTPAKARYKGGDFRKMDTLEQAHVTYGLEGIGMSDPDFYTAQVFTTALGGGMSSRLFQEVREKRGLCYSVYAFSHFYRDGGLIGIYAGTGSKELKNLTPVLLGEIEAMAATSTAEEVARARAQIKAGLLMSLESPSDRAEQVASQILNFGRVIEVDELVRRIDAVDEGKVSAFATRVLKAGRPSLAALGPIAALEKYERIASRLG